ncbi:hypothetical protein PHYBLDRAFT_142440 [Phycomyces blakesleeanus NRRL 1555(-)]|uniref:Uncharacterized protein n=1 Tax=Phycomyces blakesleeanus (strain ATCC 8743b / DSM 1359 / FGSC 10004 / NBRC 33097 / NRRL 1555) TaxID=763407 RepID=A0A162ULJ1_PHYB8|nr:hypothetical protein PHYBLDRAFT_142440 [Phycomyces blakesleeanus NRRL 1555(-)]OAD76932.1 hypothetical protein PHYBLDRAFT_142440 [Phycomyces blakesleeanus NRRL 1555(-)]|eukprot:XP_018294972.1 hypothetical protein PHYBLDRAFT_142440 [Phycomyces blakesleeanus NRRL 1555(-)]
MSPISRRNLHQTRCLGLSNLDNARRQLCAPLPAHDLGHIEQVLLEFLHWWALDLRKHLHVSLAVQEQIPILTLVLQQYAESCDLFSLLTTLDDKMTAISSNVNAQSTGMQAVLDSDMDPQDIISSSSHPKISSIIQRQLRDINLKTDDLELIRENDDKPTWDVNVGLSDEFNKNLASDLMLYICRQPVAAMVPLKELCGIIVNSYYNCLAASKLTEEDRQTNSISNRKGNRKTALNKRRKRMYTKHKDAIIEKFNQDYNVVFYRDAMSGDETETNISVVVSRPDWRSDELNTMVSQ